MIKTDVSPDELNAIMDFDRVIEVREDGSIIDRQDIYAPDLYVEDIKQVRYTSWLGTVWNLMNGYSGQDRYSGPIMHASEFVGGGMARDILEEPGVYVTVVAYFPPDHDEDNADCLAGTCEHKYEPDGWAVARRAES